MCEFCTQWRLLRMHMVRIMRGVVLAKSVEQLFFCLWTKTGIAVGPVYCSDRYKSRVRALGGLG